MGKPKSSYEMLWVGVVLVAKCCKINHDYTGQWIPRNWDTMWRKPWKKKK